MVLGMHRSGASLVSNVLHLLGVDMVDQPGYVRRDGSGGFWEREDIVEIQEQILSAIGFPIGSPAHCVPFPTGWWRAVELRPLKRKLQDLLASHLDGVRRPWGFKDPRTCRLLPLWGEILEELDIAPRFVWAIRQATDTAASMAKNMPDLRQVPAAQSEVMWLAYNYDILRYSGRSWPLIVPYEAWFQDPLALAKDIAHELDLAWQGSEHELETALSELVNPENPKDRSSDGKKKPPYSVSDRFYHSILNLRTATDSMAGEDIALTLQSLLNAVQPFAVAARDAVQLREEVRSISASLDDAKNHARSLQQEFANLTAIGTTRLAEIARLEDDNSKLRRDFAALRAEAENSIAARQKLEADLGAAIIKSEDLRRQISVEVTKRDSYRLELAAVMSDQASLREALAVAQGQVAEVEAERDDLAAELGQLVQAREQSLLELADHGAKFEKAQEHIAEVYLQRDSLQAELDQVAAELEAQRSHADALTAAHDALQQEHASLAAERDHLRLELEQSENSSEELRQSLNDFTTSHAAAEQQISELVSQLDERQAEAERLAQEIAILGNDLSEARAERDALASENAQANERLALAGGLQQRLDDSASEHAEVMRQLTAVVAERDAGLADVAEKMRELALFSEEVQRLEAALAAAEAEKEQFRSEADLLKAQQNSLSSAVDELENQRQTLHARLLVAEREAEHTVRMRQEEARLKSEIASLRNKLRDEREAHAEERAKMLFSAHAPHASPDAA